MFQSSCDDATSTCYLSFAIINLCGFAMIIGFFSGTSEMYSGVEPCLHKVAAEAFQPGHGFAEEQAIENREMQICLDLLESYLMGNGAGHWFNVLFPVMIISGFNIVLFSVFWYIRSWQLRFRYMCLPCSDGMNKSDPPPQAYGDNNPAAADSQDQFDQNMDGSVNVDQNNGQWPEAQDAAPAWKTQQQQVWHQEAAERAQQQEQEWQPEAQQQPEQDQSWNQQQGNQQHATYAQY